MFPDRGSWVPVKESPGPEQFREHGRVHRAREIYQLQDLAGTSADHVRVNVLRFELNQF